MEFLLWIAIAVLAVLGLLTLLGRGRSLRRY